MSVSSPLRTLEPLNRPSVADTVFDELHSQILLLELPPGTKMSEVEVARALGVSRQPVRDAFLPALEARLPVDPAAAGDAGVADIVDRRPAGPFRAQRAGSGKTVRTACRMLTSADHAALDVILGKGNARRSRPGTPVSFHGFDDQFHKEICERSGLGFAWDIIRENKAHNGPGAGSCPCPSPRGTRSMTISKSWTRFGSGTRKGPCITCASICRGSREQIVRIRADHERYFADEPET